MSKFLSAVGRVARIAGKRPVVISVLAVGLALIVSAIPSVLWRLQRMRALASLERVAQVSQRSPRWARNLFGEQYSRLFVEEVQVRFEWSEDVRDDDIRLLTRVGKLESLSFEYWNLREEHLEPVRALDHIGRLSLRSARLSPEALRIVVNLRNVDSLDLNRANVDDSAVEQLSQMPCRALCLSNTQVTNRCLPAISKMGQLESLDLSYTRIGGAAFRHIARLDRLQTLKLEATNFNDVSAEWISDLKALRELDLGYTLITDSGVKNLADLPVLEHVSLIWTPVTPAGWSYVSSRLPGCHAQLGEARR